MVVFVWNVLDEAIHADAISPRVVGQKEAFANSTGKRFGDGHAGGEASEGVAPTDEEGADQGKPAKEDAAGDARVEKGGGVEEDEAFYAIRFVSEGREADGTAPIVDDKPDSLHAKVVEQAAEVVDVGGEVVGKGVVGRLVREAAAQMIGNDATDSGIFLT